MKPIRSSACLRRPSASRRASTATVRSGPQVDEVLGGAERRHRDGAADQQAADAAPRLGGDPAQPLERVDSRRPLRRRERQQALDEAGQVGVEAGGRRNVSPPRAIEQRRVVVRLGIGRPAREQFVQQQTEAVEVARGRRCFAPRLLGAHVRERAQYPLRPRSRVPHSTGAGNRAQLVGAGEPGGFWGGRGGPIMPSGRRNPRGAGRPGVRGGNLGASSGKRSGQAEIEHLDAARAGQHDVARLGGRGARRPPRA